MSDNPRVRLYFPTEADRAELAEYIAEHLAAGERELHGSALLDELPFDEWLQNTRNNADRATVRADWVRAETYLCRRESDGRLVGLIDIRFELNDFLAKFGGNIGFGVRPSERRRGYGSAMLAQALEIARDNGLARVLLGCYADNHASKNLILRMNGKLKFCGSYIDEKPMEMYEIIF